MADKQSAPQVEDGSLHSATEAFLSMMVPETETPETEEAAPTEDVEESTEETQDEPLEEVEDSEELEEFEEDSTDEDEYEDEEEVYAVKVDGQEMEVSLEELVKGYSRQSDYTRKTQELAEQRKSIDEAKNQYEMEIQQIQQERQQYVAGLQQVLAQSTEELQRLANTDWETLQATDPIKFITEKEKFRDMQDKIHSYQKEQAIAEQRRQSEFDRARSIALQQERKHLVEKMPEWGDPSKQASIASELKSYAMQEGFTSDELDDLIDHRSLIVLRKAMLYDKANSKDIVKRKLKGKPKVVKAGSKRTRKETESQQRNASMKRLKQTGDTKDAASLLEAFVDL
jgi:hypothetical protein